MKTNFGELETNQILSYFDKLVGRVFKIIPMNEEECNTIDSYVDNLVRELFGNSNIFMGSELLSISGTLKGLNCNNHKSLKSDVFKVIDLINKAKERVE